MTTTAETSRTVTISKSRWHNRSKTMTLSSTLSRQRPSTTCRRWLSACWPLDFDKSCSHVYSACRREFLEESLSRLGLQKLSIEEVHKMPWQELEDEIDRWIKAAHVALRILFPTERHLYDSVFFDFSSAADLSFMIALRRGLDPETQCQSKTIPYELSENLAGEIVVAGIGNFIGRFQNLGDVGKNADKYIKYGVEDIDARINELFKGKASTRK